MTNNCQWCESKTEAYFSGDLNPEDLNAFDAHLASCAGCREQVEGIKGIDPVVQQVFQRRLALARSAAGWNTGPRVWKVALAGSSIALAALLAVSLATTLRQEAPATEIVKKTPEVVQPFVDPLIEDPKVKSNPATDPQLGKTEEGTSVPPAPQPGLDNRDAGPDFVIVDLSGQAWNLNDFRGRVLVFGIVSSDQKEAVANLKGLYKDFGSNPNIRILGVANHRDDKIDAGFPLWFNHASRLLGLENGQFMLIDSAGKSKLRGTLGNAADDEKVRAQLSQLTTK